MKANQPKHALRKWFAGARPGLFILGLAAGIMLLLYGSRSLSAPDSAQEISAALAKSETRFTEEPPASSMHPVQTPWPVNAARFNTIEQRWASANAEQDQMRREEEIQALLDELADADPGAVLAYLQDVPMPAMLEFAGGLARRYAVIDPAAATAWLTQLPEGSVRAAAVDQVAVAWADQDLAGAIEWACQLPPGADHNQAVRQVAYEAARTDPLTALNLAVTLPTDPAQDALIEHAWLQWAGQDLAAATQWAEQIEDSSLRDKVISGVATVAVEKDPLWAATFALDALPVGREQNDAVVGIVQRWVQIDPSAASAWVTRLPADQLGRDAMDAMVNVWSFQDPGAVGEWLLTLTAGDLRNTGSVALARNLERSDPILARQWQAWGSGEE